MPDLTWQKSSFCIEDACLEVAKTSDAVSLRDSKAPDTVLTLTAADWQAFLAGVKTGEFDQH
jgi:hypothetical protein